MYSCLIIIANYRVIIVIRRVVTLSIRTYFCFKRVNLRSLIWMGPSRTNGFQTFVLKFFRVFKNSK